MKNKRFFLIMALTTLIMQGCKNETSKQDSYDVGNECLIDTVVNINNKELHIDVAIKDESERFIEKVSYGENGKEFVTKVFDNYLLIQIGKKEYLIRKDEIPYLDSLFIKKSIFQRVELLKVLDNKFVFDITFGEDDTDDIIFIHLTIDINGNKSFAIIYPEEFGEE